jgi:hypothetical protein
VALAFTLRKYYLKAKRKIMETQIFISPCKNILIFKKTSKKNQNPSSYYNYVTNLEFQHKAKNIIFSKILI